MAFMFRYRFVDFGTVFAGNDGTRGADQGSESPGTLFSNELVTDVGGTCCNGNEPLAIIDHHFTREHQFPAASAAVLHKAKLIRDRFAGQSGVFWLVTHKQPDFDAFCSMYLARWILEEPAAIIDWQDCGLAPDGWSDSGERRKINWYEPDLHNVSDEQRWPLLMASYAAIVDNSRQFSCPRNRALHSILYAALKRGRNYLSETSGAKDLFDAIKLAIRDKKRNPIYDSLFEDVTEFAPELAMLDRELEAYVRDVRRARKSIVYLQHCKESFPACFQKLTERPLFAGADALTPNVEHFVFSHQRVPTDGIYLRDPECLLFKEWARLDLEHSSLGRGFEFTAVAYSNGRPEGSSNQTDYFFAIDPERANGRHLYGVWARLQSYEVLACREGGQASDTAARRGFEKRAGTLAKFFGDPWFDGQNYFFTIVATPNHGTVIAPPGVEPGLRDDRVAELVRSELEDSVYQASSGELDPRVRVIDLSPTRREADAPAREFPVSQLHRIDAPAEPRFRFAQIRLCDDVPISPVGPRNGLSRQIGETLWQVLYPDLQGATPPEFTQRHLVVAPRCVGVWGDRGIAIAYKPSESTSRDENHGGSEQDFMNIIALAREIDRLIADSKKLSASPSSSPAMQTPAENAHEAADPNLGDEIAARGEVLARKAAQIKHNLTLPHSELFRRFYEATGIDELLSNLRDLNQTAAEYIRRERMAEQARKLGENTETVAEVQSKLEWVEIFIVGVYAAEVLDIFTRHGGEETSGAARLPLLIAFTIVMALTTIILRPWEKKTPKREGLLPRPAWLLIIVFGVCALGIAWMLRHT